MDQSNNATRHQLRGYILISLFLALCLAVISGCSRSEPAQKHVGIIIFGETRKILVSGFIEGLAGFGYKEGETIRYTVLNAHRDKSKLRELVKGLREIDVDLIAAAGGLEADAVKAELIPADNIPTIVLCASNIIERKLINSRQHSGWAVTGVDSLNIELTGKRLQLLLELSPSARRILILYTNKKGSPSKKGVQYALDAADKMGLQIDARPVSSPKDVRLIMKSLQTGDVDAMLMLPAGQLVNSFYKVILPEIERLHLPLFSHFRFATEAGALASFGPDYSGIGKQAARLADKVLRGMPPEQIPFEVTQLYEYAVNRDVVTELGIEINEKTRSKIDIFVHTSPRERN